MSNNVNPDTWKKILKVAIAVLSALMGALFEANTAIMSNLSNIM